MDPNNAGPPPSPYPYSYPQAPVYPPGPYPQAPYPQAPYPQVAASPPRWSKVPSRAEIVGLIAAFLPFVASVSSGSIETENGHVVRYEYHDAVAILGGLVAAACAVVALVRLPRRTEPARRGLRALIVLALVAFAVLQLLRGFGTIGGPAMG